MYEFTQLEQLLAPTTFCVLRRFFIVYVAFENYPMCFSLYALFTILSVSLLNFLRKFTQLEYLLYIEKLIHQHMLQTQRYLPVLCFYCPRTLDTISIFVPVVVSLSPFLAPVYTIWILCCVYKLVHCHLLHAAHSLCITVFFYRQHHFGQRLCCVLHVLRFTSCFNEFATLRHTVIVQLLVGWLSQPQHL